MIAVEGKKKRKFLNYWLNSYTGTRSLITLPCVTNGEEMIEGLFSVAGKKKVKIHIIIPWAYVM